MLLVGADSQRQRCLEAVVPSCDLCLRADALPALVRGFLPRDARRAVLSLAKAIHPACTLRLCAIPLTRSHCVCRAWCAAEAIVGAERMGAGVGDVRCCGGRPWRQRGCGWGRSALS